MRLYADVPASLTVDCTSTGWTCRVNAHRSAAHVQIAVTFSCSAASLDALYTIFLQELPLHFSMTAEEAEALQKAFAEKINKLVQQSLTRAQAADTNLKSVQKTARGHALELRRVLKAFNARIGHTRTSTDS